MVRNLQRGSERMYGEFNSSNALRVPSFLSIIVYCTSVRLKLPFVVALTIHTCIFLCVRLYALRTDTVGRRSRLYGV